MRLNVFNSLIGLCVATAGVSCSDALVNDVDMQPVGGEKSDMISFVVAENNTTRGGSFGNRPCGGAFLRSSNGADSLYLKSEVSDFNYGLSTRAGEISNDNLPSLLHMTCRVRTSGSQYMYYFENTLFEKNENVWSSNPPYYWLNNDAHFNFYGYYTPAEAMGVEFIAGNGDNAYVPSIEYTVPTDVTKHFDLAYSASSATEYIATDKVLVPVNIKHALSRIRFKTGSGMAAGTIKSVSITNVCNKGKLDLGSGQWDRYDSKGDFTLSGLNVSADNADITPEDNYFMLLPQTIGAGAKIVVEFEPEGQAASPYTASLENVTWEDGKSYTYTITISPDLEIDVVPETVDAHYVIAKAHVKVPDNQPNLNWTLKVSSNSNQSGELPTVSDQLNEYQQDGFWTDRILFQADGKTESVDNGSARGENSFSGTGSKYVYIFIPENDGNAPRDIKLELLYNGSLADSQTFEQKCPDWVGDFGWEEIEEYSEWIGSNGEFTPRPGQPQAPWGYLWTRSVTYQRDNIWLNMLVYGPIIEDLANQNDPNRNYTTVTNTSIFQRVKIVINYADLNNLNGVKLSENDGLSNTRNLYDYSGGAVTGSLEDAVSKVSGMVKVSENGTNSAESAALSIILKKNKYDIKIIEKKDGEDRDEAPSVYIESSSIKWFMPAKKQLEQLPSHSDLNGNYWSSTSDGNQNAFTSAGSVRRDQTHKIRACRMRNL